MTAIATTPNAARWFRAKAAAWYARRRMATFFTTRQADVRTGNRGSGAW